jgi:chromosome segregation ATPase
VQQVTPDKVTWNELDFDLPRLMRPSPSSSMLSGDLIPTAGMISSAKTYTEAEVKTIVALAYQRAAKIAEHVANGSEHMDDAPYAILALADTDPLAEVQALKSELAEARAAHDVDQKAYLSAWSRAEAAEAEVVQLKTKIAELEETIEDYRSEIYWIKDRYDV